jgi:hypothetical protein
MKTFVTKTFLALLLGMAIFVSLRLVLPKKKNYNSAFIIKLKTLARNKYQKKIVLFGGSSIGWGLSASEIEKSTGLKTINLGHHAGFGLTDFQNFVMSNISEKDIIIFSPEWHFFFNPTDYDTATLDNLASNIEYGIMTKNVHHFLTGLFSKIEMDFKPNIDSINSPYRYDCINENGDVISHCGMSPRGPRRYSLSNTTWNYEKFLNTFNFITRKNTVLLFPPTQLDFYKRYESQLSYLQYFLKNQDIQLVNNISENLYNDSSFFDAEYHLTCENRTKRTNAIILFIKNRFQL